MNKINGTKPDRDAYIEQFKEDVKQHTLHQVFGWKVNEYSFVALVEQMLYLSSYKLQSDPNYMLEIDDRAFIEEFIHEHKQFKELILDNSDIKDWVVDKDLFRLGQMSFGAFDQPLNETV